VCDIVCVCVWVMHSPKADKEDQETPFDHDSDGSFYMACYYRFCDSLNLTGSVRDTEHVNCTTWSRYKQWQHNLIKYIPRYLS